MEGKRERVPFRLSHMLFYLYLLAIPTFVIVLAILFVIVTTEELRLPVFLLLFGVGLVELASGSYRILGLHDIRGAVALVLTVILIAIAVLFLVL
ncbi:MAG: hypothetical protein ACE5IJ_04810 [Thermoplasmata archaeon]